MQLFRITDTGLPEVGSLFSAVLLTAEGKLGLTARRLAALRGQIEFREELYDCLSELNDDPRLADVVVIDCDGFGGLDAVLRPIRLLCPDDLRAPIILISADCRVQTFPQRRSEPVFLRGPVSSIALRLAMETILQDRLPTMQD